ncbi:MAG: TasA family protein [Sciscionella sp.]
MKKNKKLATAAGSIAIVAAAVAVTAGTYSYFTDTQTNGGSVGAGTLRLVATGSAIDGMTASNVAPGWTSGQKNLTLKDAGSLPGKLRVTATPSGDSTLLSKINMTMSGTGIGTVTVPLSQVVASNFIVPGAPMQPEEERSYTLQMSIPSTVGNEIQGTNASFSIKTDLLQVNAPNNTPAVP